MSTTVFPFTVLRPFSEIALTDTVGRDLNGGLTTRRAKFTDAPGWLYVATLTLRFPRGGYTVDDWHSFIAARSGAVDTFLFKGHADLFHDVTNEAVGTGDGSTTAFALDKKHIDASTLVVKVNGVTQTSGVDYSLSGNNTAPTLAFSSPPTAGHAITASYDYYMPVWFTADPPPPEMLRGGSTTATSTHVVNSVGIAEQYPGAHLV